MSGNPIHIDGIEIPSDNPLFLTVIGIHVLAALMAVIAGAVAMLSRKQRGRHSLAGTIYFYALIIVFITVCIISFLRWRDDYHLFILGALSFVLAFLARSAARKQWHNWAVYHLSCMGSSYIILLTAFYVDNGRFLPLWKSFPPIVYWTLPATVGIPIILYTYWRHPIFRKDGG